jgi:hypothetical protein
LSYLSSNNYGAQGGKVWRRKASSGSGGSHHITSDENHQAGVFSSGINTSGNNNGKYSSSSPFSPQENSPFREGNNSMLSTRKILSELTNIDSLNDSLLIMDSHSKFE